MTKRKPLAGIYQLTTFLALVLLLLILFISAAYFFMIPAPEGAAEQGDLLAEVAAKRSTWESAQPASFRYVVDRDCYCDPRLRGAVCRDRRARQQVGRFRHRD